MIAALAMAAAVAAVNIGSGWWLGRAAPGRMRLQAAGFLFRFVVLFGAAQALWMRRRRAREVVVFILAAATAQLVGQVYFFLRKKEKKTSHA